MVQTARNTFQFTASSASDGEDAPAICERLVREAERVGASDVHIQMRSDAAEISFRLDGVLQSVSQLPGPIAERVCGRLKFLARLKTYQDSLPQDGRIERQDIGTRNDIRVATYPTVTGEKIVLRLFQSPEIKSLRELELPDTLCADLELLLRQSSGLLLLTGPAGSGKTTTIYACLRQLVELGGRQIITVEDPAEQIIPGVMQTEVNETRGLDFAKAARHLLRQDPQVLVIGEIRDEETANIAVRAALTGHLVISTLHAGSCNGVIERLLVLCRDHSAVAAALRMVVNQRLVRAVCPECARSETRDSKESCVSCLGSGYRGRLPVVEWLNITDEARALIAQGNARGISAQPTLRQNAERLTGAGRTDMEELKRVLG